MFLLHCFVAITLPGGGGPTEQASGIKPRGSSLGDQASGITSRGSSLREQGKRPRRQQSRGPEDESPVATKGPWSWSGTGNEAVLIDELASVACPRTRRPGLSKEAPQGS